MADDHWSKDINEQHETLMGKVHPESNLGKAKAALRTRAVEICREAAHLVGGDRETQHGNKMNNMRNIADLWSVYLGIPISAEQHAWMMVLMKCARTKTGAHNLDDYIDAAGYAGCAAEVHEELTPIGMPISSNVPTKSEEIMEELAKKEIPEFLRHKET